MARMIKPGKRLLFKNAIKQDPIVINRDQSYHSDVPSFHISVPEHKRRAEERLRQLQLEEQRLLQKKRQRKSNGVYDDSAPEPQLELKNKTRNRFNVEPRRKLYSNRSIQKENAVLVQQEQQQQSDKTLSPVMDDIQQQSAAALAAASSIRNASKTNSATNSEKKGGGSTNRSSKLSTVCATTNQFDYTAILNANKLQSQVAGGSALLEDEDEEDDINSNLALQADSNDIESGISLPVSVQSKSKSLAKVKTTFLEKSTKLAGVVSMRRPRKSVTYNNETSLTFTKLIHSTPAASKKVRSVVKQFKNNNNNKSNVSAAPKSGEHNNNMVPVIRKSPSITPPMTSTEKPAVEEICSTISPPSAISKENSIESSQVFDSSKDSQQKNTTETNIEKHFTAPANTTNRLNSNKSVRAATKYNNSIQRIDQEVVVCSENKDSIDEIDQFGEEQEEETLPIETDKTSTNTASSSIKHYYEMVEQSGENIIDQEEEENGDETLRSNLAKKKKNRTPKKPKKYFLDHVVLPTPEIFVPDPSKFTPNCRRSKRTRLLGPGRPTYKLTNGISEIVGAKHVKVLIPTSQDSFNKRKQLAKKLVTGGSRKTTTKMQISDETDC